MELKQALNPQTANLTKENIDAYAVKDSSTMRQSHIDEIR